VKHLFLILLLFSFISCWSQRAEDESIPEEILLLNEQLIVNINSARWLYVPSKMNQKFNSAGGDVLVMFPLFGKKTWFSMAAGADLSAQNYKSNYIPVTNTSGITSLRRFPDTVDYRQNKLTMAYIDIPLEFRFRTFPHYKKRNFKFTLGVSAGCLLTSYIKYSGEDYRLVQNKVNENVKFKEYHVKNLLPYRYGVFARIGYGKINFTGYYTLSNLFGKKGPEVVPFTIGISMIIM
jgi:hypothetical protein